MNYRNYASPQTEIQEKLATLKQMRALWIEEKRLPSNGEHRQAKLLMNDIEKRSEIFRDSEYDFPQRTNDINTDLDNVERWSKTPASPVQRTPIDTENDYTTRGRIYNTFGEQLRAVARAGYPGGEVDQRLHKVRAASGLGESIGSDGGYLVDKPLAQTLLTTLWDESQIIKLCRHITISGGANGVRFPGLSETSRADGSRAGGILGYWLSEAAEKQASKPSFRQIDLELKKLVGLCYTTDELLQDAGLLEQAITTAFQQEFDFRLTDAIINGSGAGQPLGICQSDAIVSVSKEPGQSADTIVFENILKMWSRLIGSSHRYSVWLIHPSALLQLYSMSMAVGTSGVPVFMPAGGASAQPYSTLFGRPVIPCEQCAVLGDSGDILLADLSQYLLATKGNIQKDVSIHMRFVYGESVFRFLLRVDGCPILANPVLPFRGTETLSHFVKIDARD